MFIRSLLLCAIISLAGCVGMNQEPPAETTQDGLQLVSNDRLDLLYIRPGSDFSGYESVFIAAPEVEFARDWKRKQNISDPHRVTDRDMDSIRRIISDQVVEIFTDELTEGSGYRVVDSPETADLILTPEVTDLDIINPLNNQSYRITVLAENSGGMTMTAELADAGSNQALLRFTDKSRGRERLDYRRQDSVWIRSENNRLMRAWAQSLNSVLNQGQSPG